MEIFKITKRVQVNERIASYIRANDAISCIKILNEENSLGFKTAKIS